MKAIDMFESENPKDSLTDEECLVMWQQASGELRGLANYLQGTGRGITAMQIRMALRLADAQWCHLSMLRKKAIDDAVARATGMWMDGPRDEPQTEGR